MAARWGCLGSCSCRSALQATRRFAAYGSGRLHDLQEHAASLAVLFRSTSPLSKKLKVSSLPSYRGNELGVESSRTLPTIQPCRFPLPKKITQQTEDTIIPKRAQSRMLQHHLKMQQQAEGQELSRKSLEFLLGGSLNVLGPFCGFCRFPVGGAARGSECGLRTY